jgi:hypothetical protein
MQGHSLINQNGADEFAERANDHDAIDTMVKGHD